MVEIIEVEIRDPDILYEVNVNTNGGAMISLYNDPVINPRHLHVNSD